MWAGVTTLWHPNARENPRGTLTNYLLEPARGTEIMKLRCTCDAQSDIVQK